MKNHSVSLRSFLMLWASQSVSAMGTAMPNDALVIWVYIQNGTASSITSLTLCSFMPTILLRFTAGALADQWDKKRIMLLSDLIAACGTMAVLALHASSALMIVHLYAINFLMSCMNAFQVPAAYVATSLLVPKEHYARAGGLQAVSDAVISILSPVLGSVVLAWGGLTAVLAIDLVTFAIAFLTLLAIRVPKIERAQQGKGESLWQSCLSGLRYLKAHSHLLRLILLIAAVNFLAKLGPDGQMPAFVLSRTQGSEAALGAVQSSVAVGLLCGGALVTVMKSTANRTRMILRMCSLIFLAGMALALSRYVIGWCAAAFLQYLFAAIMNVHWNALMRSTVPPQLQGRVFSARDTIQSCTIPLGLYLGGVLTDKVFEPWMAYASGMSPMLAYAFGEGSGAGIALLFFLVSLAGFALSLACARSKRFQGPMDPTHEAAFHEN